RRWRKASEAPTLSTGIKKSHKKKQHQKTSRGRVLSAASQRQVPLAKQQTLMHFSAASQRSAIWPQTMGPRIAPRALVAKIHADSCGEHSSCSKNGAHTGTHEPRIVKFKNINSERRKCIVGRWSFVIRHSLAV